MKRRLPADYQAWLEEDGVNEASTDGEPGYFQLWHPDEVEEMNRSCQVAENAPGFYGFGSDGGGEMLAFDHTGAVFMIPFVGMAPEEARRIASSWSEVADRITK